jgi:sugar/nucleoside kinase (ribokinase family)
MLKPNVSECRKAIGLNLPPADAAQALAGRCGRPVFCTSGADGIWVAHPGERPIFVPAVAVTGLLDTVGAGDSASAGLACALASAAALEQAAAFANLVASITIQQIGTTGTATPQQVRMRWRELNCPKTLGPV